MRSSVILGIALAAIGAFVLMRGLSYRSERDVVRVGDLQVTAETQRSIPPWAGGLAIAGGLVLVGVGMRGRRNN